MNAEYINLEIYNEATKNPINNWDFLYKKFFDVKNKILGKDYSLSLSILQPSSAQSINRKTRKQNYKPNTLSFIYSKSTGEIIICPEIAEKEEYDLVDSKLDNKLIFLFIHSCLHLKGLDHGVKMDQSEKKFTNQFVI